MTDTEALRAALIKCREQFDFYAREHRSAQKFAKAETNQQFADLCDDALRAALSPPADPDAEARSPIDEDRRDSIIAGMCMTWDHNFGLMSGDEQNALWRQMAQLFEHDVLPAMLAFAAAEREACAKVAELEAGAFADDGDGDYWIARRIAAAIRARGE